MFFSSTRLIADWNAAARESDDEIRPSGAMHLVERSNVAAYRIVTVAPRPPVNSLTRSTNPRPCSRARDRRPAPLQPISRHQRLSPALPTLCRFTDIPPLAPACTNTVSRHSFVRCVMQYDVILIGIAAACSSHSSTCGTRSIPHRYSEPAPRHPDRSLPVPRQKVSAGLPRV
jgi:hypothetical protein